MDTVRVLCQSSVHKSLDAYIRDLPYDCYVSLKEEIGRRIRDARNRKGWSQEELARETGWLKKSRIGNYEQGTRTPGPEEARALANPLGVSAAWILCVDDDSTLPADERALLEKYRASDERGKRTIQGVAESQPTYKGQVEDVG